MRSRFHPPLAAARPALLVLALIALLCGPTGCVRRRLMITSNPPGGMAYVDNQPLGLTPVSTPFLYYGTREFRIEKAGFETAAVKRSIDSPWYEIPPLDFVSENFWPGELRDERVVHFDLQPQRIVPPEEVRRRGEDLRASVQQGRLTALPGANFQGPLPSPQAQPAFRPPGPGAADTLPPFGRPVDAPPAESSTAAPQSGPPFYAPPFAGPPIAGQPSGPGFESAPPAPAPYGGASSAPPLILRTPAF